MLGGCPDERGWGKKIKSAGQAVKQQKSRKNP
jgi:predicted small secreted protein